MLDHQLAQLHELPDESKSLVRAEHVYLCGCAESKACEAHERMNGAQRLRAIEERDISALASHVEGPNTLGWVDLFCAECESNLCTRDSARELAEKAYVELKWMVHHGNVLCFDCQNL